MYIQVLKVYRTPGPTAINIQACLTHDPSMYSCIKVENYGLLL